MTRSHSDHHISSVTYREAEFRKNLTECFVPCALALTLLERLKMGEERHSASPNVTYDMERQRRNSMRVAGLYLRNLCEATICLALPT